MKRFSGFHKFPDGSGSFEVFEHKPCDSFPIEDLEPFEHGWYWRACFPGCIPDGEPSGPFKTAEEAHNDATD
jgi:hypothetical protein